MLYEKIIDNFKDIKNIEYSLSLLNWDQSVNMPKNGINSRIEVMGTLSKITHQKIIDDTFYKDIITLIESNDFNRLDDIKKKEIVRIEKIVRKARKIPVSFAEILTKTTSKSMAIWEDAKKNDNDKEYLPILKEVFELKNEYSNFIGYKDDPYDTMLDDYDEGLKYSYIAPLFEKIEKSIVEILKKIGTQEKSDFSDKIFEKDKQMEFGTYVLKLMGLDFNSTREDLSAHPFTTRIGVNDVRITTDIIPEDLFKGLYSTIHEGGHCLYELEVCKNFNDSPLGILESLSLHESQSRFYENVVGKSLKFLDYIFPELKSRFPEQLYNIDLKTFYKIVNKVEKSPIRIESDELTYNLHIILRTEIEHNIINNKFSVDKIEEVWNEKTKQILGFYPKNKREGYLQDIHWADGLFGYFPTYTLGNLIASQFYYKIQKESDCFKNFNEKSFSTILNWFRNNLYNKGSCYTSNETVMLITGEDIKSEYFIKYLEDKFLFL